MFERSLKIMWISMFGFMIGLGVLITFATLVGLIVYV